VRELHLFAGAGGGILGGILLGHTTVCAVELEPYCRRVLLQRQRDGILPRFPIWDDVRTFDGKPWRGRVDVVCGGFPCQDISAAGKGAGIDGERSGLWGEFARIIREVGPRLVFVENSPMLTSRGLGRVLGDLAAMGFDARWCVLGACDVGAPHKRERIWILADAASWRDRAEHPRSDFGTISGCDGAGDNATVGVADTDNSRSRERRARQDWRAESGSEGAMADARSERFAEARELPTRRIRETGWGGSEALPDANGAQRERVRRAERGTQERTDARVGCSWWRQDPADEPESGVGRMAHGVANRVDRLKAIGNGQVPAVAALAWRTLNAH